MTRRALGVAVAALGCAAIAALTLTPRPEAQALAAETPISCLICGRFGVVDVILNILLFLPLGAGLRLAGLSSRSLIAAVLATTVAVEALQFSFIPGRDPSLSDVITNTAGGLLGALVAARWRSFLLPRPRAGQVLAACAGLVWLGAAGLTAWALAPAPPATAYWGQWAHDFPGLDRFRGQVLAASLQGMSVPDERLPKSALVRYKMLTEPIVFRVAAIVGPPTERPAPIVSVGDGRGDDVIALRQHGRDLILLLLLRAGQLRLHSPSMALDSALRSAGDTVALGGGLHDRRIWLTARSPRGTASREVVLSPQLGWSLFIPSSYAFGPAMRLFTASWIVGFLLPIGYWTAGDGRSRRQRLSALACIGALLVAGLLAVPAAFGFPYAHWSEWMAGAWGAIVGWYVRGRRDRGAAARLLRDGLHS